MEVSLKQKLFYFFPVLFCFCLPFGSRILGALVVCWIVASFFNLNKADFIKGLRNRKLILFYLFFLVTVLSALLSSNSTEAGFSVEVKLTFFFFPYLFFCFQWPTAILKRCIISFVSGCFFACLYLIGRASLYAFDGRPDYFFYSLFSDFIHASYFAMYLILAIIFVVLLYNDWFKSQRSVIYSSYFFVSIFIASIFLCSSKLGLISFFISMPLLFLYKFREKLNGRIMLTFAVAFLLLFVVLMKVAPQAFNRFKSLSAVSLQTIDKTSSESTTVRILIWQEALTLIQNNFVFGTGVGDANDQLYEAYKQNGLTGAYEHRFNAHNQFLQTFIGLGFIGFVILLAITFGTLIQAIFKKHFLLIIFSMIIILNFMVESMLQTSAGVLFFVFFSCFFEKVNLNYLLIDENFNMPENRQTPN